MIALNYVGCTSHPDEKVIETIKIVDVSQDIRLPRQIFQEMEKDISADLKGISASYVFIPLQVKLLQSNSQALKKNEIIYSFPKGGGLLDLKTIVEGRGSFFISFPKEQFSELPDLEHLFFISNAPKMEIDGEKFGLGCRRWVDLKKQFSELQKDDFLKLNSSDQRHQFVLNGTYLFVFRKASQVYLSQLTITDTENKVPNCVNKG